MDFTKTCFCERAVLGKGLWFQQQPNPTSSFLTLQKLLWKWMVANPVLTGKFKGVYSLYCTFECPCVHSWFLFSPQSFWLHLLGKEAVVSNPEAPMAAGHGVGCPNGDFTCCWHCSASHHLGHTHLHREEGKETCLEAIPFHNHRGP